MGHLLFFLRTAEDSKLRFVAKEGIERENTQVLGKGELEHLRKTLAWCVCAWGGGGKGRGFGLNLVGRGCKVEVPGSKKSF